ncbi:uncharacterized protein LOC109604257 [Aethina tumida]|uniref:uncharacterized protein LOC109604257 n=1 Tax=Aethina tumida TaxID=116153 RepID=UPI00214959A8|nr:uncharacterized protein LOC109604257 [Aethina tumida]
MSRCKLLAFLLITAQWYHTQARDINLNGGLYDLDEIRPVPVIHRCGTNEDKVCIGKACYCACSNGFGKLQGVCRPFIKTIARPTYCFDPHEVLACKLPDCTCKDCLCVGECKLRCLCQEGYVRSPLNKMCIKRP